MQPRTMIWLGIGGLGLAAAALAFVYFGQSDVKTASRQSQSQDQLHNVVIGLHDYESATHQLLAGATWNDAVPPLETHCWRTQLLPYLFHFTSMFTRSST
jgi:hypothetical protein